MPRFQINIVFLSFGGAVGRQYGDGFLETDFLKTLALVAETGSMAEASRRLSITPAAVAHQLRALEKDVGAPLTVRAGRSVGLTTEGRTVLSHSQTLLSELAELRAAVHRPAMQGTLRLGVINSALNVFIPDVLGRYAVARPDVRVQVHAGISHKLFHQLQEDQIDIAVCQAPPFTLPKAFGWIPVREEPLVVWAHESLRRRTPLELLRTQPFIRYDRNLGGGKQATAYLQKHDIVPDEKFELDSLATIALLVHRRFGVSLVPDVSSSLIDSLDVVALPLGDDTSRRTFGMMWKRSTEQSALVDAWLAESRAVLAGEPSRF